MTGLLLDPDDDQLGTAQAATRELNRRSGRCGTPRQWIEILEPAYRQLFMPGDPTALI